MPNSILAAKLRAFINTVLSDHVVLTPTTGQTLNLNTRYTLLNPATTLATLTVNLPATPGDGVQGILSSTRAITSLTVSGNGNTIANAPTSLVAGGSFGYIFDAALSAWLRTN